MDPVILGLFFAVIAGLSTAVGGAIVFFVKDLKKSHVTFSLAFATGVMITVSFMKLLPVGIKVIGMNYALISFFAGMALAFLIDFFVPHEYILEKVTKEKRQHIANPILLRTGLFVALGLAIHNFPEGFAIFAGSLQSIELGLIMTIAIVIHNIPEGIAVSIPIYFSTKNKFKSFFISALSGLAEPIGALIGLVVLLPFLSKEFIGVSLAFVAGIMVYICIDELLPAAASQAEKNSHLMTLGFFLGSAVMGATLILLV